MSELEKNKLSPGLYLVATPIGNMGDLSRRALETLQSAAYIACEDMRVTGKLLKAHGIKSALLSYNDHSATGQRGKITGLIQSGHSVALVSDAGMPLISDPGYKLVQDCREKNLAVTSIPGPNAPLTALQLSGLPSDRFCFLGFLPPKSAARRKALLEWKNVPATLIAFETAPRLQASLGDMQAVLGDRETAVARELTKIYEEVRTAPLPVLVAHYRENGPPKGEIVIVIGPPPQRAPDNESVTDDIRSALETMSVRDAAAFVAEKTGLPKKDIYARTLELAQARTMNEDRNAP
jgi:16S rRNA (cytidine1402-2'-O)-methyltransferase